MPASNQFGSAIRKLREGRDLPLRVIAAYLDIDKAILSKAENGKRRLTRSQVVKLAEYFAANQDTLLIAWLSDKLIAEMRDEELALEAFKLAEEQISYSKFIENDPVNIFDKISETLQSDNRVAEAWLFGSYARGEQKPGSDIDLMVRFAEGKRISLFDLADITYTLETNTKRKIDLVEKDCIRGFAWATVKNELIKIYG